MATLQTKSIGTSSRDYSTVIAWEAAIPADLVSDDEIWRGECYNDSAFSEFRIVIDGHTVDATRYIELTAATGEEHDGTEGSGVEIEGTDGSGWAVIRVQDPYVRINKLELWSADLTNIYGIRVDPEAAGNIYIDKILAHNITTAVALLGSTLPNVQVTNTFAYSLYGSNSIAFEGAPGDTTKLECFNVTALRTETDADHQSCGFRYGIFKNCAAFHFGGSGGWKDFLNMDSSSDYNISSDDSADDVGSNSLINKTATDNFVSISDGSEDLHLKSGADCIGAGVDLSGTFTDDIDGDIRSSWDMSGDEFIAAGGGIQVLRRRIEGY